jgi:hypothetical protein
LSLQLLSAFNFELSAFSFFASSFYASWFTQFNPEGLFNRGSKIICKIQDTTPKTLSIKKIYFDLGK